MTVIPFPASKKGPPCQAICDLAMKLLGAFSRELPGAKFTISFVEDRHDYGLQIERIPDDDSTGWICEVLSASEISDGPDDDFLARRAHNILRDASGRLPPP